MTIEEAIRILDPETRRETMQKIPVFERIDADQAACRLAIAALRAQQEVEKNEPLTLEDLQEMHGEPVWLEEVGHDRYGEWDICYGTSGLGGADPLVCFSNDFFDVKNYGVTWLAYRHKTKEG